MQTSQAKPAVGADASPQSVNAVKKSVAKVSREDEKLCRRLESLSGQSLLEIGVDDGKRARRLAETLSGIAASTSQPATYIAIDEFEMGGGSLTLRTFHQQLREHRVKAHLVPMPVDAGLDRVVRTFGQVDVIVWGGPQPPTETQRQTLSRLSKPGTIVFSQIDGRWSESQRRIGTEEPTRRAA